jgi:AraC family transcriptional regulator
MSRSRSKLQSNPEQNEPNGNSDRSLRYSEQLLHLPVLASYEAEWNNINLEYYRQPAGETPNLCFEHYVIGIEMSQGCQLDFQVDGIAQGQVQKRTTSRGAMILVPAHHCNWAHCDRQLEGLILNLKTDLLTRNAAELLAVEQVELLPYAQIYDPLILQIALALKADLDSHKPGGRLYAETVTSTLAVHLLRNYSSHQHRSIRYPGGLSPTQLKLVIDYINDYLEQDLSLKELAAIAQLSAYHFCRSFKQSTGLTPHQYVIRQRVERAKLLLKDGKMGISEVAIACGFTHQSHLNRHFKQLTGVTPNFFSKS